MTAAILCDGPGCDARESDEDAAVSWWRLERNGTHIQWAPGMLQPISLTYEGDDESDPLLDDLPDVVPHFHSARCLASWAEGAAAFDA